MTPNEKFLTDELSKVSAKAQVTQDILLNLLVLLVSKGIVTKEEAKTIDQETFK